MYRQATSKESQTRMSLQTDTISFSTVTLSSYSQDTEDTKVSDFRTSALLQTDRAVKQLCAVDKGHQGPLVISIGDPLSVIASIEGDVGDKFRFVSGDGSRVSGDHVLDTITGEVLADYSANKDIAQAKSYFLEMCLDDDLLLYSFTETIKGTDAPVYEGIFQTQLQMLTGEVYTIELPSINARDKSTEVTETLRVKNVGTGDVYFLGNPPTDAPIVVEDRVVTITPAPSNFT